MQSESARVLFIILRRAQIILVLYSQVALPLRWFNWLRIVRQNVSPTGFLARHYLLLIALSDHWVDTSLLLAFILSWVVVPGLTEGGRLLSLAHASIVATDLSGQLIVVATRNQMGARAHIILAPHVRRLVVCLMDASWIVLWFLIVQETLYIVVL